MPIVTSMPSTANLLPSLRRRFLTDKNGFPKFKIW
jgi:hypothetical protein